jgi:hypothetical protein
MRKGLGGKLIVFKSYQETVRQSAVLNIFLMFEIFLVSSWDISHSQFGIQNQILVSRGYWDTANFRPCTYRICIFHSCSWLGLNKCMKFIYQINPSDCIWGLLKNF